MCIWRNAKACTTTWNLGCADEESLIGRTLSDLEAARTPEEPFFPPQETRPTSMILQPSTSLDMSQQPPGVRLSTHHQPGALKTVPSSISSKAGLVTNASRSDRKDALQMHVSVGPVFHSTAMARIPGGTGPGTAFPVHRNKSNYSFCSVLHVWKA